MGLTKDWTYVGQVLSIQECADSFSKKTGGTSFCHKVKILLDATGETIDTQICLDYPRVELFEANDNIKFKAHALSKNEWTIHFVEKVYKKPPASTSLQHVGDQSVATKDVHGHQGWIGAGNPVITGTVIDRAFSHTAHFLQMRGNVSDDDFIKLAKRVAKEMVEFAKEETLPF